MILEIVGYSLASVLISISCYLFIQGAINHQKYQFFKKNAPGLKVLENPRLFGGHLNNFIYARYNWALGEKVLEKYGPTVGVYFANKPAVITTDLDFIKTVTLDEQIHVNRMLVDLPIKDLEEDCIMFAGDEQWLRLRKAIAPAFTAHRIKLPNVQSNINEIIDKLVGLFERRLDEAKERRQENFVELNAEDICQRYSLGLVFKNFYKQDNVIDFESAEDKYVSLIERGLEEFISPIAIACGAFPWIRPVVNWFIVNFHEQGRLRNTVMNYIKEQTKKNFEVARKIERKEKLADKSGIIDEERDNLIDADNLLLNDGSKFRRNMIDYITDQYREGKLTRSEYFNSTFFLFFAADKTTSDCLSRLLYNLAYHPEKQEKLRQSILESGTESEYLSWVIHETLRLHPPAQIGCSRMIKRDTKTKHGLVPAGTYMITLARTIGRLKQYWGEDADEFRPERWIDAKNFHPCQYLAFGGGRRACPGKELALMDIKMLLNVLMRKYKFEKSNIHTIDNSDAYTAPLFCFSLFDTPTYVRVTRIES